MAACIDLCTEDNQLEDKGSEQRAGVSWAEF